MASSSSKINEFSFPAGRKIGSRYTVESYLGGGWEGEVYRVVELPTGITRAAKIFYPQRNLKDKTVRFYAQKLDRLRKCSIVTQYAHSESIRHRGETLTCLISELVEGEKLLHFLERQPGKHMQPFEALHLLYAMTCGIVEIHAAGEYHGDLHSENILVTRRGIDFEVKLIDFFNWGSPTSATRREDVIQLVQLLHELIGGRKWYAKMPQAIKTICCGLRRDLIGRKFPTALHLKTHLETFDWDE